MKPPVLSGSISLTWAPRSWLPGELRRAGIAGVGPRLGRGVPAPPASACAATRSRSAAAARRESRQCASTASCAVGARCVNGRARPSKSEAGERVLEAAAAACRSRRAPRASRCAICSSMRCAISTGSAPGAVTVRAAIAASTANCRSSSARSGRARPGARSVGQAARPIEPPTASSRSAQQAATDEGPTVHPGWYHTRRRQRGARMRLSAGFALALVAAAVGGCGGLPPAATVADRRRRRRLASRSNWLAGDARHARRDQRR